MAKILKQKAREFFDQTKKVTCPAFPKEKVYFNAKGLNHIFYKGSRKGRTKQQVATKVRLLPHAVEILKAMPLPQEQGEYLKGKIKTDLASGMPGVIYLNSNAPYGAFCACLRLNHWPNKPCG